MKRLPLLSLSFAGALFALPLLANAATDMRVVTLPLGNDLYVVGSTATVSRAIAGDVVVAGGQVRILSSTSSDVLAAGGQVDIEGLVGDDVRVAGGTVRVSGTVGGDVLVMGGTVILADGAEVKGNVVSFGGTIDIRGTVRGSLKAGGGSVHVSGDVKGGADINAGTLALDGTISGKSRMVADIITVGPEARLQGSVDYWTKQGEVDFSPALQGGSGATFQPSLARSELPVKESGLAAFGFLSAWAVFSLLSGAILIAILLFLFPVSVREAGKRLSRSPWKHLGIGFLYFVAVPALCILLFLTLLGIPLGLFLLIFYIFTLFFAGCITAAVLTRWVEATLQTKLHPLLAVVIAVLIFIALKALWFVPVIGWVARLILICMAFGGLLASVWARRSAA